LSVGHIQVYRLKYSIIRNHHPHLAKRYSVNYTENILIMLEVVTSYLFIKKFK